MHQSTRSTGIRGWMKAGVIGILLLLWVLLAPAHSASLSGLDSDPGLEQTQVSPQELESLVEEDTLLDQEVQQDIDEIQTQIQDDLEALQAATNDATSAVTDLLEQSQRATQLTARETWDEFLDQLMKWKLMAQIRTRHHIQTTRHILEEVGESLSQTVEDDQNPLDPSEPSEERDPSLGS